MLIDQRQEELDDAREKVYHTIRQLVQARAQSALIEVRLEEAEAEMAEAGKEEEEKPQDEKRHQAGEGKEEEEDGNQ